MKNDMEPMGINTLYTDGHAVFCTDRKIFDWALWNPDNPDQHPLSPNAIWDHGPGNNLAEYLEILRRLQAQ